MCAYKISRAKVMVEKYRCPPPRRFCAYNTRGGIYYIKSCVDVLQVSTSRLFTKRYFTSRLLSIFYILYFDSKWYLSCLVYYTMARLLFVGRSFFSRQLSRKLYAQFKTTLNPNFYGENNFITSIFFNCFILMMIITLFGT